MSNIRKRKRKKVSNNIDKVRDSHCGICIGFGMEIHAQLSLKPEVLLHPQCVLPGAQSVLRQLAEHLEGSLQA